MGFRDRIAQFGRRVGAVVDAASGRFDEPLTTTSSSAPSAAAFNAGGAGALDVQSLYNAMNGRGAPTGAEMLDLRGELFAKGGAQGGVSASGNAASYGNLTEYGPIDDPKALYWDPFSMVQQLGFREKPSALTFATMAAMVWRVPILQAIIQTRCNQISAFATPQHYKFETGFRVKMRDAFAKPTAADKKFIARMENELLLSGVDNGHTLGRDSFEALLRKLTRDTLTYDQMCVEIVPGRDGRPARWLAVDAGTMRLADTARLAPEDDPDAIHSVQIYDNVIIAEFTRREMAFEVRNPRTDIRGYGYGTSELEMCISTITAILWAWQYNQNFFSQGSVAKGLLNLVGAIPEKQLRAFRRQWYQMVSGVDNAFRTPITNADKVEWHSMQASNRDMEFSAWMDFLIKVVSAIYAMDPVEINFKYGNSGGGKSMFEGAQRAKSQESRERGLRPLLRHIGRMIDKHIIWPIDPAFTLEFVGLESQTPKELADLTTQRVRTLYTIDELRAENDMAPLADGMGQLILDANWINVRNMKEEQKQAQAQQQLAAQQPGAVGGVDHLDTLLSQLETKSGKSGSGSAQSDKTGKGASGSGTTRAAPAPKAGKDGSGSGAGQTTKEITNELQGDAVSASMREPSVSRALSKAIVLEVKL